MADEEFHNIVLKLVVLGDSNVGKTALINRYVEHKFKEDYRPTLGVNIVVKEVKLEEVKGRARLVLWDIAGQEKYQLTRKAFFIGCIGALFVYDVTNKNSLDSIKSKWIIDYQQFINKSGIYLIIGNKSDLEEQRVIPTEKGRALAQELNASEFIETSAKTGNNVDAAFKKLVSHAIERFNLT